MIRVLLVIAATLLLAACGWQLRGTPQYLALESLSLDGPSYELRRRLELALEESHHVHRHRYPPPSVS